MNRWRMSLLFLVQAGTVLSWLYPWVAFVALAVVGRRLPFGYALAAFAYSAAVVCFSRTRGLRNYLVLSLQIVGFAGVAAAFVHELYYGSYALLSLDWVRLAFGPHAGMQSAEMVFLVLSLVAYWTGGALIARKRVTYRDVCSRFDIGLVMFFALFLLEMVVRGGPETAGSSSLYSLFSFFLLGFLSIGMSKSKPAAPRRYRRGYGLIGVFAGFFATIFLAVGSVILFFLPAMKRAAEVGYGAFGTGARVTMSFVVPVLRFVMGFRGSPPPAAPPQDMGSIDYSVIPTTWYGRLLQQVTVWGMEGLAAILILAAVALLAFLFVRWLLARSAAPGRRATPTGGGHRRLLWWWVLMASVIARIGKWLGRPANAIDLYTALQSWGGRSGVPPRPADTPIEFGGRLVFRYPQLRDEVDRVVKAVNIEVYRGTLLTRDQLSSVSSGLRSIRSPRLWLKRLKGRYTNRERDIEAVAGGPAPGYRDNPE